MAISLLRLGVLLLGLLIAWPAAARTVYQWTDDQGLTHFSDTPPEDRDYRAVEVEGGLPADEPDDAQEARGGDSDGDVAGQGEEEGNLAEDINLDEARLRVERIEERVAKARRQYQQARRNRIEGEQVRYGNEQNYVRYLERIQELQARESRAEQQLRDLQQQLEAARERLRELESQAEDSGP